MPQQSLFAIAFAATMAHAAVPTLSVLTPEPVIGILTTPIAAAEVPCLTLAATRGFSEADGVVQCFSDFYVKWLESAGARTVFIPFNADDETLSTILHGVNGVLFTGGGLNLTFENPYVQTAQRIFDLVKAMNDAGDFLPLHGTCMGMQTLSILAAGNASVLSTYAFDSENMSVPLNFTPDGVSGSRLFSTAPPAVVRTFATENVTENLHHDGVFASTFASNAALQDFFMLISTNQDREGREFVSTLEARDYPITATQWHPERPQFEHKEGLGLTHTLDAMYAMQYVANYFVQLTRGSNHTFTNATLLDEIALYGYAPTRVGPLMDGYGGYVFQWP
jgi:gamma-glutamyl hydrolase